MITAVGGVFAQEFAGRAEAPVCGVCGARARVRVEYLHAVRATRVTATCDHKDYGKLNPLGNRPAALTENIEVVELDDHPMTMSASGAVRWPSSTAFSAGHGLTTVLDGAAFAAGKYVVTSSAPNGPRPATSTASPVTPAGHYVRFIAETIDLKPGDPVVFGADSTRCRRASAYEPVLGFVAATSYTGGLPHAGVAHVDVRMGPAGMVGLEPAPIATTRFVSKRAFALAPFDVVVAAHDDKVLGDHLASAERAVVIASVVALGEVRLHLRRQRDTRYFGVRAKGDYEFVVDTEHLQGKDE